MYHTAQFYVDSEVSRITLGFFSTGLAHYLFLKMNLPGPQRTIRTFLWNIAPFLALVKRNPKLMPTHFSPLCASRTVFQDRALKCSGGFPVHLHQLPQNRVCFTHYISIAGFVQTKCFPGKNNPLKIYYTNSPSLPF